MDFRAIYDLESYLFATVNARYVRQGYLPAFDFFCIVIWKANRAKSKVAKGLLRHGHADLETAVGALTSGIRDQATHKDRLRYLLRDWTFRLPMATAILTVLYPESFTVYDIRVCDTLGEFHRLTNVVNFENLWSGYEEFTARVQAAVPAGLSLRDADRYLWGKSFRTQLAADIARQFTPEGAQGDPLPAGSAVEVDDSPIA